MSNLRNGNETRQRFRQLARYLSKPVNLLNVLLNNFFFLRYHEQELLYSPTKRAYSPTYSPTYNSMNGPTNNRQCLFTPKANTSYVDIYGKINF